MNNTHYIKNALFVIKVMFVHNVLATPTVVSFNCFHGSSALSLWELPHDSSLVLHCHNNDHLQGQRVNLSTCAAQRFRAGGQKPCPALFSLHKCQLKVNYFCTFSNNSQWKSSQRQRRNYLILSQLWQLTIRC